MREENYDVSECFHWCLTSLRLVCCCSSCPRRFTSFARVLSKHTCSKLMEGRNSSANGSSQHACVCQLIAKRYRFLSDAERSKQSWWLQITQGWRSHQRLLNWLIMQLLVARAWCPSPSTLQLTWIWLVSAPINNQATINRAINSYCNTLIYSIIQGSSVITSSIYINTIYTHTRTLGLQHKHAHGRCYSHVKLHRHSDSQAFKWNFELFFLDYKT